LWSELLRTRSSFFFGYRVDDCIAAVRSLDGSVPRFARAGIHTLYLVPSWNAGLSNFLERARYWRKESKYSGQYVPSCDPAEYRII
jgi:hypothetical protein